MNPLPKIIDNPLQRLGWTELLVFTLLTALSVYTGQISIFYIIYLFWWNELINTLVDFFYGKLSREKNSTAPKESLAGLFPLFIYFVFIIVFFAFMANWDNNKLLIVNIRILMFKNIYFNLNLLYIAIIRIYMLVNKQIQPQTSKIFTGNMMVLHISIILGAFAMFFIVRKYPLIFTPDNLWGSVLVIAPFLLLRFFFQVRQLKKEKQV